MLATDARIEKCDRLPKFLNANSISLTICLICILYSNRVSATSLKNSCTLVLARVGSFNKKHFTAKLKPEASEPECKSVTRIETLLPLIR